jgi:hypothetical protein
MEAYMQISFKGNYISIRQFEYIGRQINEAGSMTGGWLKKCGDEKI